MGEIVEKPLDPALDIADGIDPTTLDGRDPRRKHDKAWMRAGCPTSDAPQGLLTGGLQ
jgi:hypothetical protein